MAELTPAQRAAADAIIAGTFDATYDPAGVDNEASTASQYSGNGSMAMPGYTRGEIYGGLLPSGGTTPLNTAATNLPQANSTVSPYMTADEQDTLRQQVAASKALQAAIGAGRPAPTTMVASVPMPRQRPFDAPTPMDIAAADALGAINAKFPGPATPRGAAAYQPGSLKAYADAVSTAGRPTTTITVSGGASAAPATRVDQLRRSGMSPSQAYDEANRSASESAHNSGRYGNDGKPSYDPVSNTWRS